MLLRKPRVPRDEGLELIAEWQRRFLAMQLDAIEAREPTPDQRTQETAEAERLTAAYGERMRAEYELSKQR